MKKILRQGSTKKYRARCAVCDTEFEYQGADIMYDARVQARVVECPNCGILIEHQGNPSSQISTENF